MSRAELREEVEATVEDLNSEKFHDDDQFEAEINTHASGPAIDITNGGEAPDKILGQFYRAAMRAGYVGTGSLAGTRDGKSRIFLHEAEEYFDLAEEEEDEETIEIDLSDATVIVEGGIEGLYPEFDYGPSFEAEPISDIDADELVRELEGVEDAQNAINEIEEMNAETLSDGCGGVIEAFDDVEGELYVAAPAHVSASDFDTPGGWKAINDNHGGVRFIRK